MSSPNNHREHGLLLNRSWKLAVVPETGIVAVLRQMCFSAFLLPLHRYLVRHSFAASFLLRYATSTGIGVGVTEGLFQLTCVRFMDLRFGYKSYGICDIGGRFRVYSILTAYCLYQFCTRIYFDLECTRSTARVGG